MATITKKKALSNFQWADQAKNTAQANAWLIPSTPKLDTNSVIASQLNTPADIFKQKYANQWMTTPVVTTPITPVTQKALSSFQVNGWADVAKTEAQANAWLIPTTPNSLIGWLSGNTSTPTTSWPTNQQNMDALTANVATVAENAKRKSDEQKSELKYGAQQRDYKLDSIKATADTDQMRLDRQMADQTLQVDRAIADTDRISKRNIAMVEKVAALQGTGKSSGFGQWMLNLKEDTIRTIDRLKEDLDRAKTASWEEAKLLWENYNRNKEKIDNDFEYQFRDFTNRQTASIAELTTAWYDPVKVNKALGKIYEEAQYKTQELFTNYVNNYQTLNNETRLQSQEIRTQEQFKDSQQKEFISQYIGYNGERLASQTLTDLKWYLDNGQISKNDYDLYTKMIGDNTIATLQQHGTVTEDDLANIEQLLKIWYTPTKAVAFMIQSNPTRFTPQESKTPNIQTYEVNGEKYSWYFDQSGNFVNMSAPWGWGGWDTPSTDAVSLISKWEWFRDKAYQDSAWVWTVWFWFTNLNGRPVQPWDTIDRASAEQLLQKEIWNRQNFMNYITVPLNENQKAALASFEYNLWSGIWEKNAMWILNKVNQWDLAWAASLMKQYVNAWGKPIKWLVNRRNEEAGLLTQAPQWQSSQAPQAQQFDPNKTAQYTSYVETGKMPVGMKSWSAQAEQFIKEANQWYIAAKEAVANQAWFTISNPDAFIGVDDKVRDTINKWLTSLPAFRSTMEELIKLVEKNWTELLPWSTKTQMQQLATNAKLQAKEIYNLWVLNWPDLDLMNTIIPDPTSWTAKLNQLFWMWVSYKDALKNAKDTVLSVWSSNASQVGLSPVWSDNISTETIKLTPWRIKK